MYYSVDSVRCQLAYVLCTTDVSWPMYYSVDSIRCQLAYVLLRALNAHLPNASDGP